MVVRSGHKRAEFLHRKANHDFAAERVVTPSAILENIKMFGRVYCTLCARTVDAEITVRPQTGSRNASLRATPGQKCSRCAGSLDAALVMD
jgi:hypothetical protein